MLNTPTDLDLGSYDICATNGTDKKIGKFVVTSSGSSSSSLLVITDIVNNKTKEGTAVTVSVFYTGTLADGSYTVTVGGKAATLGKKSKTKFQFTSSSKLAVGKHDIILTTGGVSKKSGLLQLQHNENKDYFFKIRRCIKNLKIIFQKIQKKLK